MQSLVAYDAPVMRVVLDNLNIHRMASLYETSPAAGDCRIVKRLEPHHTAKPASWLNMVEIEFSVLTRELPPGTPRGPWGIGRSHRRLWGPTQRRQGHH